MWIELDEFRMIDLAKVKKIECGEFVLELFDMYSKGGTKTQYFIRIFMNDDNPEMSTILGFKTKRERDAKYKYFKKLLKDK